MKLKNKRKLSKYKYDKLYCSTATCPQFYGLIKLHKGHPIRPIVAFNGSPSYSVSKTLSNILTPFTNLSDKKLKNSYEAKSCLENLAIPEDHALVSFDVKALFTSVPTDIAVEYVSRILSQNENLLKEQTALSREDVLELLNICIHSAAFSFENQIYN